MAYFGVFTVTGEGNIDFGGNVNVVFVNTWISGLGDTQLLSISSPQRIMHAGWIALGYAGGVFPSSPPSIQWFKYLEFESESLVIANIARGSANCNHLYYHLAVGVTLQLFIGT